MKSIPDPGFAGDTGAPDAALTAALGAFAAGAEPTGVYAALLAGRLLVPVVAVAGERDPVSGAEKHTDMATVLIRGGDGRTALPAFTGLTALNEWNAEARPVPVTGALACAAVLAEGADLLVLDPGGPVTFAVEGPALRALAQGREPEPPLTDPAVRTAVEEVAAGVAAISRVRLLPAAEPGPDAVLAFGIRPDGGPPTAVAEALAQALSDHPVLRERLDGGLDLAYVPGW